MAMSMRITERTLSTTTLAGLQTNLNKMSNIQEKLSSGKQLSRPSDSPVDTVSAMGLRSELQELRQYARNADDGMGWLSIADSTLSSASTQANKAREIALQGVSAGPGSSPAAREALANEVLHLRDSLLNLANTTYMDRPIFGGTTSGKIAYNDDGSYAVPSPAGTVTRTVGPGAKVRVDTGGPETFGTGQNQLFTVLSDLATHLVSNPAALADDLDRLEVAANLLVQKAGDVGARYNRLTQMKQTSEDRTLEMKTQLSNIEDIDLPQTIVELQLQETAYKAALAATAKAIQPSLVDFLR